MSDQFTILIQGGPNPRELERVARKVDGATGFARNDRNTLAAGAQRTARGADPADPDGLWARVTQVHLDGDVYVHAWVEQGALADGGWANVSGARSGTILTQPIVAVGGHPISVGRVVRAYRVTTEDGTVQYRAVEVPRGVHFAVALTKITGGPGTVSTPCDFLYRVQDLDGNYLGDTFDDPIGPVAPRPNGIMTEATEGAAYYDVDGSLVLATAYETPATDNDCGGA